MRVFVIVLYGNDNDTAIVGVDTDRHRARVKAEKARGQCVQFSETEIDDPNGNVALEDESGDLIGHLLSYEA